MSHPSHVLPAIIGIAFGVALGTASACTGPSQSQSNRANQPAPEPARSSQTIQSDETNEVELTEAQQLLDEHIPPLESGTKGRWPIMVWQGPSETPQTLEMLVDRGVSPMFVRSRLRPGDANQPSSTSRILQQFKYLQSRDMPLIILPQGLVQSAFVDRRGGEDHLPPARSSSVNSNFKCPAWLYENPRLDQERARAHGLARLLKQQGITPASLWIDFETGAYLRNRTEEEDNVAKAMQEASRCPRCRQRFGEEAFTSLENYRAVVDEARAHAIHYAFVEPVRAIFPDLPLGNFFAYPHNRLPKEPGIYSAYGYEGSGMNVAMPRLYAFAGMGGLRNTQNEVDAAFFLRCLDQFSPVSEVLKPDEYLVPWVGTLFGHRHQLRRAERGAVFPSGDIHGEVVRHMMLRGAETFAVFAPQDIEASLDPVYSDSVQNPDFGPFLFAVKPVQSAYADVLRFNDHLRAGRVLTYDVISGPESDDEPIFIWSGVATDDRALVRTFSLRGEGSSSIEIFGSSVDVPFCREGQWLWIDRELNVTTAD